MFAFPSFSGALLAAAISFHAGQQPLAFPAAQIAAQVGVASGTVTGTIWYPVDSSVAEQPQGIGRDPVHPVFEAGSAAVGAAIAPSPKTFPLILLSHGTGGSAGQMAWLGTALARAGYVAVAIDQIGNTSAGANTVQGNILWWLRARELSMALDAVLADPQLGPRIDRTRIAAAGFSLGGATVIALAGSRTSTKDFLAYCAQHPHAAGNCQSPPEFPDLVAQLNALRASDPSFAKALADGSGSVADPRVRAVYAIAPALGEAVTLQSLATIAIPVRIAYGTADVTVDPAIDALRYASAIPQASVLTVAGAGHYTFLDTCTPLGVSVIPGPVCADGSGVGRDDAHAQVAADAIAFFRRNLGM